MAALTREISPVAEKGSPPNSAVGRLKNLFLVTVVFSLTINVLMLTGPLFMLQVYDRVLASRSVPTLVVLFGLVVGLYLCLGLFDFLRARLLSRMAYRFDTDLMQPAQKLWIFQGLKGHSAVARPTQELAVLRQFTVSNGLPALLDLPWVPIYLVFVYALHFWLGLLATVGAGVVIAIAMLNEKLTSKPSGHAANVEFEEGRFSDISHRNAESILAMGMLGNVLNIWSDLRLSALGEAQEAGNVSEIMSALSKVSRLLMQSTILALGAYLAIFQEISPGAMIASSILAGRALAPVDQAVGNWRSFLRARHAYRRLSIMLLDQGEEEVPVVLPAPKGYLSVKNLVKLTPRNAAGDAKPILHGVSFELQPGDALGVIGPSASGKSSLAKMLTGLWPADRGEIRIDGACFDQWDRDALGRHIGYLPQSVELLPGSIRNNICRFDPEARDEEVIEAAQMAGVHELILSLPKGYSSNVNDGITMLSGGQVQRIALARAVFRKPTLVVLDEPNSNLDAEGEQALSRAIRALREAGSIVVVMAHRPSAIASVNLLLMLNNGQQVEFDQKEEVLRKVARPVSATPLQTVS